MGLWGWVSSPNSGSLKGLPGGGLAVTPFLCPPYCLPRPSPVHPAALPNEYAACQSALILSRKPACETLRQQSEQSNIPSCDRPLGARFVASVINQTEIHMTEYPKMMHTWPVRSHTITAFLSSYTTASTFAFGHN